MKRILYIALLLLVVSAEIAFLIPSKKRLVIVVLPDKTSYKTDYWTTGGPPPNEIATGEYYHLARRNDSVFDISNGIPIYLANNAIHIGCGAHNAYYIDASHVAHIEGSNGSGEQGTKNTIGNDNAYGFQTVTTDSSGITTLHFSDIKFGQAHTAYTGTQSFWFTVGLNYDDSTLWAAGMLYGGRCGNGTACAMASPGFVKVPIPGGKKVIQIQVSWGITALCSDGTVYTWGAGDGGVDGSILGQGSSPVFNTPTQISLPAAANRIAGGGLVSYAVIPSLNKLYMWGSVNHSLYQTLNSGNTRVPIDITTNLGFSPNNIMEMKVNDGPTTYCVLNDGTLRVWGGREQGELGDGTIIDYSRYGGFPLPYGSGYPPATKLYYHYDQGYNETGAGVSVVIQVLPINPTHGKTNWLHVNTNACGYCYQAYFMDANGNIYFCGRNKAALCNGILPWDYVAGPTQSEYPNSWDRAFICYVNIFGQTTQYYSPSPDCLPSGTDLHTDACSLYSPGSHTAPTASLTLSAVQIGGRWAIVADNSGSSDAHIIMQRIMYQYSGPHSLDLGVQDQPKDTIYTAAGANLASGDSYTIHAKIVNNYYDSTIATASVTIPSACGGCITLPVNVRFSYNNNNHENIYYQPAYAALFGRERTN